MSPENARIFLVDKERTARYLKFNFRLDGHEVVSEARDLLEALEKTKQEVREKGVNVAVIDGFFDCALFQGQELIEILTKTCPGINIVNFCCDRPPLEVSGIFVPKTELSQLREAVKRI